MYVTLRGGERPGTVPGAAPGDAAAEDPAAAAGAAHVPSGSTGVRPARRRRGPAAVSGTVLLLGLVSLLTDVSSESVAAVLPLYVTLVLGLSPFVYGVVDALYLGASAVVRLAGGWLSDRTDRPKWVALSGYALSALSRAALLPAGGLALLVAAVSADRIGKGIRTAPRDALITTASRPEHLGRAFGVHRAMDTAGALLGPLLAFAVLALIPLGFDVVFVASLALAVTGVAVLGLLVPDLRLRAPAASGRGVQARPRLRHLADARLGRLVAATALLGLVTVGDGFLYLALQRRDDFAAQWFPLLFVGTSATYLLLAVPLGRLADRIGRMRVFLAGHVVLLAAYACVGAPAGGVALAAGALLLLGVYYAATDGVLAAAAGQLVAPEVRATGIAAVQTASALSRAGASLLFGLAWTLGDRGTAVAVAMAGLALALPVAALLVRGIGQAASPTGQDRGRPASTDAVSP